MLLKKSGDQAQAQRLIDRGLAQVEQAAGEQATGALDGGRVSTETPRSGPSLAWSSGNVLAMTDFGAVAILTPKLEQRLLLDGHGVVAISPDGVALALGSAGIVHLWDAATGDAVAAFPLASFGGLGDATALAFSPDGSALAVATMWRSPNVAASRGVSGSMVAVLDVATGKQLFEAHWEPNTRLGCAKACAKRESQTCASCERELVKPVRALACSPDGKLLAASSEDSVIRLWDVAAGKEAGTLPGVGPIAFSPDGKTVAVGARVKPSASCSDFCPVLRAVRLWDTAKRKALRTFDDAGYFAEFVAFSPDGAKLYTAASTPSDCSPPCLTSRRVAIWDVATAHQDKTIDGPSEHPAKENAVAFSPDGKYVATVWDDTLTTWELASGQALANLDGYLGGFPHRRVSLGISGTRLATASCDDNGGDVTVRVTDIAAGKELWRFPWGESWPGSPVLSGRGDQLLVTSDWRSGVWDVATGQSKLLRAAVGPQAFSADGRTVVGRCGADPCLMDAATRNQLSKLPWNRAGVGAAAFSPDGRVLAIGAGDGAVHLRDVTGTKELARLEGHTGSVGAVAFSQDGSRLASRASDDTVRLWDLATRKQVARIPAPANDSDSSISLSPGGKRLAIGFEDKTVRLWDVEKGVELARLEGHTDAVRSVVFSRDATVLISSAAEIIFWRVADRARLATLMGTTAADASVIVTPAGFIDVLGEASHLRMLCRIGRFSFPLEACEERLVVRGLLAKVMAGDDDDVEP